MKAPGRAKISETAILFLIIVAAVLCLEIFLRKATVGTYRKEDAVTEIKEYRYSVKPSSSYCGVVQVYTFKIPKIAVRGQQLCFYVQHKYVSIRTSGERAVINRETETPHTGHTPGYYWVCIPIRLQDAGNEVKVEFTPVYKDYAASKPKFYIASKYNILKLILKNELFIFSVSTISVAIGGILAIFSFTTQFSRKDMLRMLYLSMLTLSAGIWKLMDISFIYMVYPVKGRFFYYAGAIAYVLMPVFCIRFLCYYDNDEKSRMCRKLSALCVFVSASVLLLQLFNIRDIHSESVIMMAGTTIMLFLVTGELVYRKVYTAWLMPFPFAALADLAISTLSGSSEYAVCMLLWVFINALMRGAAFIRENFLRERTMRKQAEELRDARITALMNQIRPHFIHNTLASVYYLCDEAPSKAQEVINDFMYYLQSNYNAITVKQPVPFAEELRHVQAYMAVEQVRFEGELHMTYEIEHTDFEIPALTIQPIVENSVKYGIGKGISPEHILLKTCKALHGSEVLIEDDGIGYDETPVSAGPHTGIENVRIRLALMCCGTISIERRKEGGTRVRIFIPDESS